MRRLKLDFHAVGDVGFGVLAINAASFDGVGAGTSATGGTMGGGGGSSSLTAAASSDTSTMFASTPIAAPSSDDESSFDEGGGSPQSLPSSFATGSTGSPKAADGDICAARTSSKEAGGSSMTALP